QAEDGIRDWSVTGVQTCALPICAGARRGEIVGEVRSGDDQRPGAREDRAAGGAAVQREGDVVHGDRGVALAGDAAAGGRDGAVRSEERRVGKEGRARGGSQYAEK